MGKGYEIKNVTFARGEATENREIFMVTLQKDKSVAVCYFAAANWINLSPATLEDSKRCDVREACCLQIGSLAPPLSCPAKAGHPVITENLVVTGSPAFAGDDDRARRSS